MCRRLIACLVCSSLLTLTLGVAATIAAVSIAHNTVSGWSGFNLDIAKHMKIPWITPFLLYCLANCLSGSDSGRFRTTFILYYSTKLPMIQRNLSSVIYSTSFAGCSFVTRNCCTKWVPSKPGQIHSENKAFYPTGYIICMKNWGSIVFLTYGEYKVNRLSPINWHCFSHLRILAGHVGR